MTSRCRPGRRRCSSCATRCDIKPANYTAEVTLTAGGLPTTSRAPSGAWGQERAHLPSPASSACQASSLHLRKLHTRSESQSSLLSGPLLTAGPSSSPGIAASLADLPDASERWPARQHPAQHSRTAKSNPPSVTDQEHNLLYRQSMVSPNARLAKLAVGRCPAKPAKL